MTDIVKSIQAESHMLRELEIWFRGAFKQDNLGEASLTQAAIYLYRDMASFLEIDPERATSNPIVREFLSSLKQFRDIVKDQVLPHDAALVNIAWHRQAVDPTLHPIAIGTLTDKEIENGAPYGEDSILGVYQKIAEKSQGFEVPEGVYRNVFSDDILAHVAEHGHLCPTCPGKVKGTCGSAAEVDSPLQEKPNIIDFMR